MNTYCPEAWRLLKIEADGETYYKIFGGWIGGYTTGSNWRINSGISKVVVTPVDYEFHGYSGSKYVCSHHQGRFDMYLEGVLRDILDKSSDKCEISVVGGDVIKELISGGVEVVEVM